MDVAVMVDGQENVSWDQWRAIALECESGGYQALFAADHYASVYDPGRAALDAWGVVTGLSALTKLIRLGVLVSPPTFRHPSVLARLAVTADHVSRGRTELAMGIGWNATEHASLGLPFPDTATRMEMLAEQVEIITRQWSQDTFDFRGRYYTVDNCRAFPKPYQQPRLPIIIGGSAKPRTAALAARFADEYNTTFGATPQACRDRRKQLDAACVMIGRDPRTLRLSAMIEFVLGETEEQVDVLLELIAQRQGLGSRAEFLATDGVGGESMLVGTPDVVRRRLREYADAGVDRVILQHLLHDQFDMLALAASEVLPVLHTRDG
jgi:alkanesulfonate monooxygenase SsuD/methylene tetrahydromethanopterin reductase-like flavin-dependent oxidoreductase (luciferase family)